MGRIKFGQPIIIEAELPLLEKPKHVDTTIATTPQELAPISGPVSGLNFVDLKPIEARVDAITNRLEEIDKQRKEHENLMELSICSMNKKLIPQEVVTTTATVIEPKVEQITVHKDHTQDLTELDYIISNIVIKANKRLDKQNRINLILGAGLILSLLYHLL